MWHRMEERYRCRWPYGHFTGLCVVFFFAANFRCSLGAPYLHVLAHNPPLTDAVFAYRMEEAEATHMLSKNYTSTDASPWSQCPLNTLKLSLVAYDGYTNQNISADINSGSWVQEDGGLRFGGLVSLWIVLPVSSLQTTSFSSLSSLKMLYIRSSALQTVNPGIMTPLTVLVWLCLDFCDVTNITHVTGDVTCGNTTLPDVNQCFYNA